jgi:Pyruvate-formate lyase
MEAYKDFKGNGWKDSIDVNDFILKNYTEYLGDDSFLMKPTDATVKLWNILSEMFKKEKADGVYDAETRIPSQIDAYGAGYIDKKS